MPAPNIEEAIQTTNSLIKKTKCGELVFSIIISVLLALSLVYFVFILPISALWSFILSIFVLFIVLTECILNNVFLFRERYLKLVNFFSNIKPLLFLPVFGAGQFLNYWQNTQISIDSATICSLLSTAWTIFGVSVAAIGIWFGFSFKELDSHGSLKEKASPENEQAKAEKYSDYIRALVMAFVLVLNAILLIVASSSLLTLDDTKTKGWIVGTLAFSSFAAFDLLLFFLFPLFHSFAIHSHNDNVHPIEIMRSCETALRQLEAIAEAAEALTKSINESKDDDKRTRTDTTPDDITKSKD